MITIYKYPIPLNQNFYGAFSIDLPESTLIRHVDLDGNGTACIWAEVDTNFLTSRTHKFFKCGTGKEIPDEYKYHIGSYVDGPYVWHIYKGNL